MEYYHLNALAAGLIYAFAAVFSKGALEKGCGILRLSFVINQVFFLLFAGVLVWQMEQIDWGKAYLPLLTGGCFFVGQVFTFAAIRIGDVSIQTPIMGTKAVFVAIIAILFGVEEVSLTIGLAAVLAATAIALLGLSGVKGKRMGLTISLSLLSALFFACSDQLVGVFGEDFGKRSFLIIAMAANALLSFALIPFFNAPLRRITASAWPWVLAASFGMGIQALLLNYTLAASGEVVAVNILYSARGLFSVIIGLMVGLLFTLPMEKMTARMRLQRIAGAILITIAIAIALGS